MLTDSHYPNLNLTLDIFSVNVWILPMPCNSHRRDFWIRLLGNIISIKLKCCEMDCAVAVEDLSSLYQNQNIFLRLGRVQRNWHRLRQTNMKWIQNSDCICLPVVHSHYNNDHHHQHCMMSIFATQKPKQFSSLITYLCIIRVSIRILSLWKKHDFF